MCNRHEVRARQRPAHIKMRAATAGGVVPAEGAVAGRGGGGVGGGCCRYCRPRLHGSTGRGRAASQGHTAGCTAAPSSSPRLRQRHGPAAQAAPGARILAARQQGASEGGDVKAGHGEAAGPLLHAAPYVGDHGAGLNGAAHRQEAGRRQEGGRPQDVGEGGGEGGANMRGRQLPAADGGARLASQGVQSAARRLLYTRPASQCLPPTPAHCAAVTATPATQPPPPQRAGHPRPPPSALLAAPPSRANHLRPPGCPSSPLTC